MSAPRPAPPAPNDQVTTPKTTTPRRKRSSRFTQGSLTPWVTPRRQLRSSGQPTPDTTTTTREKADPEANKKPRLQAPAPAAADDDDALFDDLSAGEELEMAALADTPRTAKTPGSSSRAAASFSSLSTPRSEASTIPNTARTLFPGTGASGVSGGTKKRKREGVSVSFDEDLLPGRRKAGGSSRRHETPRRPEPKKVKEQQQQQQSLADKVLAILEPHGVPVTARDAVRAAVGEQERETARLRAENDALERRLTSLKGDLSRMQEAL